MREFLIFFNDSGTAKICDNLVEFETDSMIRVSEKEMFEWIQTAHNDGINISVYEGTKLCDIKNV